MDRVAAATHTQIHKAVIRDLPAGSAGLAQTHGWEKSGLVVYRPQLKAPSKPVNMVAQKVDERHPVIQHTIHQASLGATGNERFTTSTRVNPSLSNPQGVHNTAPLSPAPTFRNQPESPRTMPGPSQPQHTGVPKSYVAPQADPVATTPHHANTQPTVMSQQTRQAPRSFEEPKQTAHSGVPESVNAGSSSPGRTPREYQVEPSRGPVREQGTPSYPRSYHQGEGHPQPPSNPHSNQSGQGQPNGKDSSDSKKQ